MSENINFAAITLEDCEDMYEKKRQIAVTANGKVIRFESEENDE